jgi:DNA-binding GntR family transcriptional regulator
VDEAERARVIAAHEQIVTAIESRDTEAAAAAMKAVILDGLRRSGEA